MGNKYKQYGPFVYGDPRFLAGGSQTSDVSYSDQKTSVNDGNVVIVSDKPTTSSFKQMTSLGQSIATGKCGYHGSKRTNVFVSSKDLEYPTIGVEIETIMRNCTAEAAQKFTKTIYSNWFHAENDGSLDHAHGGTYGYELVTTVLPARIYRDISVWTGFQNLVSPLLYSYTSQETGLHVHVGMNYFENTNLPATSPETLILIGKILTSVIYYSFLPRSLAQRVFLRNSDLHYCHETTNYNMTRPIKPCSGYELLDNVMDVVLAPTSGMTEENWLKVVCNAVCSDSTSVLNGINRFESCDVNSQILNYGHNSEINASPHLTLEFRRGKGTTNALSIHRMIELCMLTVLYSGYVVDHPQEFVSTDRFLKFLIDNTTSQALKTLVEKELKV